MPLEIESPLLQSESGDGSTTVHCYLIPSDGAEIKTWYMQKRQLWGIDGGSEAIQFSGCDYNGKVLEIGRFYFQTDSLMGNEIWPKRPEFLRWADNVFRVSKRMMSYSREFSAYMGKDALIWKERGGQFKSW